MDDVPRLRARIAALEASLHRLVRPDVDMRSNMTDEVVALFISRKDFDAARTLLTAPAPVQQKGDPP